MSSHTQALIQPLAKLEREMVTANRQAKAVRVELEAVPVGPRSTVYETFQLKYNLDANSPRWKKLFHRWIYLPFNRLCYFKFNLVPPDHVRCKHCGSVNNGDVGKLGWLEREGVFSQRWRAEQEAEKYPFGGVEPLAFEAGEGGATCRPRSLFPNSAARRKYERKSQQTVPVEVGAMRRLIDALALSDRDVT